MSDNLSKNANFADRMSKEEVRTLLNQILDLHQMKDRKQFAIDDLKFRSKNKDWEIANVA